MSVYLGHMAAENSAMEIFKGSRKTTREDHRLSFINFPKSVYVVAETLSDTFSAGRFVAVWDILF